MEQKKQFFLSYSFSFGSNLNSLNFVGVLVLVLMSDVNAHKPGDEELLNQVKHFALSMYLKDSRHRLEGSILQEKLMLGIDYVECAADDRGRLIVHIKTLVKRRSDTILRRIMGEDAYKASIGQTSQPLPVLAYNQCVPTDEYKIQGSNGIQIFPNSKENKSVYEEYCSIIDRVKNGEMSGEYLGIWKSEKKIQKKKPVSNEHNHQHTTDVSDLMRVEFDIVKKRRLMDQAPDDDVSECPYALQRFMDFEAHVLPALLKIDAEDKQTRHDDMLQMELDLCSGVRSIALAGGVYVAVSKAVKFPKIGATRKGDPTQRLQTLSRHVPSPFEAIYWVPTVMPFKVESEIHLHFDAFRLREKGACTEFFDVDVRVIGEYLKANYAVVETGAL